MTFEKTKAMRNAEKFLSQGKIGAAISEYEQVVMFDSKDFGTINMLGDLYSKNSETREAIKCYTTVADHYGKQGFAQKAIAVYNKISRLDPKSVEVWQKLAELYKQKGSLNEARTHFRKVADHFERTGKKLDALGIWKEIALLDPTNTEAYMSLAEGYFGENEMEDAAEAFTEAGNRFGGKEEHESAINAFKKTLTIKRADFKALSGLMRSSFALGRAQEVAGLLDELVKELPHNRELRFLLIDCLIESGEIAEAEKEVIKLVEIEPANYPKFLELAKIYISNGDVVSASRILSMSSEHMLVGGQAEQFKELVDAVLEIDADQLDALRLKARFCSWQRDEDALCKSLIRLAEVAKSSGSIDDERVALTQLKMLIPHEVGYGERLREIGREYGFDTPEVEENLFDKRFLRTAQNGSGPSVEGEIDNGPSENGFDYALETFEPAAAEADETGFAFTGEVTEVEVEGGSGEAGIESEAASDEDIRLLKEIDSIRFYIDNGYLELAEKAVGELIAEYGDRSEIAAIAGEIASKATVAETESGSTNSNDDGTARSIGIADLRSGLGIEDATADDDSDYETDFNTAIAYREMGLIERAIKEFQKAAAGVRQNDGTRRFFACANMLGLCFMEQGMPHLALKWFERALETSGLIKEEKQGVWYELAAAYEAHGDLGNAGQYFEQVYAENADFRDVSERIKSIAVSQ